MALDVVSLAIAKKYTDNAILGLGSLKGKACEIDSITYTNGVATVKFKWYATDTNNVERVQYTSLQLDNRLGINIWTSNNSYEVGDIVIYDKDVYECITKNSDATFINSKWSVYGTIKALSSIDANRTTINLEPYVLYNLGTLSSTDELNITINIPENPTGVEIYHCKFVAGASDQSISISSSDGEDIEIKGNTDFEVGTTYEISIWDYVAIVG